MYITSAKPASANRPSLRPMLVGVADHGLAVDVLQELDIPVREMGDVTLEREQVALVLGGERLERGPPLGTAGLGVDRRGAAVA